MNDEQNNPGDQSESGSRPVPDPTTLTTYALNSATQQARRDLETLRQAVEARFTAMDKAEEIHRQFADDAIMDIPNQIKHLQNLHEEKFSSIDRQFIERDVRTEQTQRTSKEALDAALLAAKELVNTQNESNAKSAEKTEASFALDLDTPLLTADGWKTMGTVEVGDTAFAEDGSPTTVLATSGVFYDSRCYTVRFSDGSAIVASDDHRWPVRDTRAWRGGPGVWKTLTTQEIVDTGVLRSAGHSGYRYRVMTNAVVETPKVNLPIDPYILGYWLGDGSSASPTITVGNEDKQYVINQIEGAGYRISNERKQAVDWGTSWALHFTNDAPRGFSVPAFLDGLGVFGSGRKRIPEIYLMASADQRRELLAGLLDSDGTISKESSRVTFNSTLTPLAEGVWQLARSLGQRATIHKYDSRPDRLPTYHVTWTPTEAPFRMPRKAAMFRAPLTDQRKWGSIIDIQPTASIPTRCLTVEHPSHVFLAGRGLIPTCNTKQIEQIGDLIRTGAAATAQQIADLKERIDRSEGGSSGRAGQVNEVRAQQVEVSARQGVQTQMFSATVAAFAIIVSILIAYFASR